jgi:hypothetical protein
MNDIDALAGFEPLRQAQHVTVSMTPFASISSNNQYISNNANLLADTQNKK